MKTISAKLLKTGFLSAAANLSNKKEYINELNVFPVPDGDTGTNMTMTIMSARKEVLKLHESASVTEVSKTIANGSLRGARGNSGVITSQIFRGFRKSFEAEEEIDEIDVFALKNAIVAARSTAYKAVMKPKEGTILTVIKAAAKKADELILEENIENKDIVDFIKEVVEAMRDALNKTPELLPVLKQAGVVDSGGMGLLTLAEGFLSAAEGHEIVLLGEDSYAPSSSTGVKNTGIDTENIKFGYCTEFIIMTAWENEHNKDKKTPLEQIEVELKEYLNSIGDCVVVVADDDIVKVHVHTNDPGLAFQKALTYGQLTSMKIDNMKEEHNEKIIKDAEHVAALQARVPSKVTQVSNVTGELKENGFVSVSAGDGLSQIFKDLGVDIVVEGGQTMNPSTEDILNSISKVNAENVFVLPNNSNIIMAAEQAAELTEDKNVIVIPTTNIPEGISTMINFIADRPVEENKNEMIKSLKHVVAGQVTYAVRDTEMDGFQIKKDDYMGMTGKKIVSVGSDKVETAADMISNMTSESTELISIYYGAEATEEDAQSLADKVMEANPDVEAEVEYGGQPVYSFIVSVE